MRMYIINDCFAGLGGLYTFHIELVWDQLLFGFRYGSYGDIYCLDLDYYEVGWIKCEHEFDALGMNPVTVRDKDNEIHIIHFGAHFGDESSYHLKAKLSDLVPSDILELNAGKYEILVNGYLRECQLLPSDLSHMIVRFYPVFYKYTHD